VRADRFANRKATLDDYHTLQSVIWGDVREPKITRNDFAGEPAFADEQRHDEDARRGNGREDVLDLGFLLPERLMELRGKYPSAQFSRVLENRRGGISFNSVPWPSTTNAASERFSAFTRKGLAKQRVTRKPVLRFFRNLLTGRAS